MYVRVRTCTPVGDRGPAHLHSMAMAAAAAHYMCCGGRLSEKVVGLGWTGVLVGECGEMRPAAGFRSLEPKSIVGLELLVY